MNEKVTFKNLRQHGSCLDILLVLYSFVSFKNCSMHSCLLFLHLVLLLCFQTTLSFIINDRNPVMFSTTTRADDNDDFMGSCNLQLEKVLLVSKSCIPVTNFYFFG